jgi:hypothetical protein
MFGIVLGWNPHVWNGWDYDLILDEVTRSGHGARRWSVGNHVNIPTGVDAWLYRQGRSEAGVIGHGIVTSEPYVREHYADPTRTSHWSSPFEWCI